MTFLDFPLLLGLALSWSLAAPPGPANAMMAHDVARGRFRAGVLTGLGAITGDLLMFALMGFGALRVVDAFPWTRPLLAAAGCALMAWFAWGAWRAARRPMDVEHAPNGSYWKSFATIVTSPFNWGWWLTVGSTLFVDLGWPVFVGFFAGLMLWVLVWCSLARLGASRFERFAEWMGYASAIVLLVFSVVVGWVAVRTAVVLLA